MKLFFRNNRIPVFSFAVITLLLQSCETLLEGSGDSAHVKYEYDPTSPGGEKVVSPSGSDFALNVAIFYMQGSAEGISRPSHSFNKGYYNPQSLYAFTQHAPGPSYTDNQIPEEQGLTSSYYTDGTDTKTNPAIQKHIRFMGGLEFVGKGEKDGAAKTHLNYLEVPLFATYWSNEISKGNIFGGLGPYIAYGIGGKIKSSTGKMSSFSETGGFRRFDAGLALTAGYRITNSFSFRLGYDMGFVNILRDAATGKAKNRSISLNIGYPLQKLIKGK